jgi:hypothetical protein
MLKYEKTRRLVLVLAAVMVSAAALFAWLRTD